MKRNILIKAIIAAMFLPFASCNPEENIGGQPVNLIVRGIENDSFEFPADKPSSLNLTVISDKDWIIAQRETGWLSIEPKEGKAGEEVTVTISSTPNEQLEFLDGVITIQSGNASRKISVSQAAGKPFLRISETEFEDDAMPGQPFVFEIKSNVDWTISTSDDWFSVDKNSGAAGESSVTVTLTANNGNARDGKITINSDAGKEEISIRQKRVAPYIICDAQDLDLTDKGDPATFTVSSNVSWTASVSETWLTILPETGNEENCTCTVTAEVNEGVERHATITLTYEELDPIVINVKQAASGLRILASWDCTLSKDEFSKKQPKWDLSLKAGSYEDPTNMDLCTLISDDGKNEAVWYCAHRADGPQSTYYRTAFSSQPAVNGHWWDDGFKFHVKGVSASAGQKLVYVGSLVGSNANSLAYWGVKFSLDGGQTWNEGETSIYYSGELVPCLSVANKSHEVNSIFTLTSDISNQEIIVFLYVIPGHYEGASPGTTVAPTSEPKSLHNTVRIAKVQAPHWGDPVNGPTVWLL